MKRNILILNIIFMYSNINLNAASIVRLFVFLLIFIEVINLHVGMARFIGIT